MKRQHQIASIVSTILMAVSFFSQPLLGQQSTSQTPAQQPPETAQQPQSNQTAPAQPGTAPSSAAPANPAPASPNDPTQQQAQPQQTQTQQPGSSGTTVNPSQAPLQPVTTYPNANETQQQQQPDQPVAAPQATTVPEGPQPKKPAEPVGAAAAESVPTAGGAAAKPAGVAIAPAKQHQTRSLLIKVGAALAAGAAIGTIFALSHSTSSTPPGANAPGVTQK
jgi:hypothetical protein